MNVSKSEFKQLHKIKLADKSKPFKKIYNEIMLFKYNMEKAYSYVKKLDEFDNVMATLLKAYIFMISGNYSKAEMMIIDIMKKELFYHSINSDIKQLNINDQIEMTLGLLKKFNNDFSKKKLMDNLIFYLFNGTSGKYQKILDRELSIKRGLSFVRSKYNSVQFGKPFAFVWGPSVYANSSQVEYREYIEKTNISKNIFKRNSDYLLFFRGVEGIDRKYKEVLLEQVKKLTKVKNYYQKDLYFRILEDNTFYQFLSAHGKDKVGLLANLKRKFFKRMLDKNKNINYSVQNLIQLGDLESDYLLKVLKLKNEGI